MDNIQVPGLIAARINGSMKPSTNLIQLIGHRAVANKIELEKSAAQAFMGGDDIYAPSSADATDGYVIITHSGHALGCGLLKNGRIKNMLPKARRAKVEFI
jgi:NOL1/NOP2/fmu family ribosome biogenesis protein